MKKIILSGLTLIAGVGIGTVIAANKMNEIVCEKQGEKEKFRVMYQMMNHWVRLRQNHNCLASYFDVRGYTKIAIYGMGDIGRLLRQELRDTSVVVAYGIDQNTSMETDIEILSPDDDMKAVDIVVVTVIAHFDDIFNRLTRKLQCPVVSLEEIVYEMV